MQTLTWSPQLQSVVKSLKQSNDQSSKYSIDNLLNKFQLSTEEIKAIKLTLHNNADAALKSNDSDEALGWWA